MNKIDKLVQDIDEKLKWMREDLEMFYNTDDKNEFDYNALIHNLNEDIKCLRKPMRQVKRVLKEDYNYEVE